VGPGRLQQSTARPHPDSDERITDRRNLRVPWPEFKHMRVYVCVVLVSGQPIGPVFKGKA